MQRPVVYEADSEQRELYPQECRLRSLTYYSQVFINIIVNKYDLDQNNKFSVKDKPNTSKPLERVPLGDVPIMLRSKYCVLNKRMDRDLHKVGECQFDQGGYFVINGSEKVIIAQERLSNNHLYVFKKQQPDKFEWICETRFECTLLFPHEKFFGYLNYFE